MRPRSRELGAYNESYNPADDNQALKGRGVHCYIVDTGVNLDHTEFRGRWSAPLIPLTDAGGQTPAHTAPD